MSWTCGLIKYSLPLNDENICSLSKGVWKSMAKKQVKTYAFSQLTEEQQKNMAFKIWNISTISLLGILTTRYCQGNFKGKVT